MSFFDFKVGELIDLINATLSGVLVYLLFHWGKSSDERNQLETFITDKLDWIEDEFASGAGNMPIDVLEARIETRSTDIERMVERVRELSGYGVTERLYDYWLRLRFCNGLIVENVRARANKSAPQDELTVKVYSLAKQAFLSELNKVC
jgi:hypothetical protein